MSWISRLAAFLLAAALASAAFAQPAPDAATTPAAPTLDELRAQLAQVPPTVDSNDDVKRLLAQIAIIGTQAQTFIASRTGQLADLNARLGELGNAPTGGATEDPDITRQRASLLKERNAVDADVRLARLVAVDAQQRGAELFRQRRDLFAAQLSARAPSPLGSGFWRDIADAWPGDIERLRALAAELRTAVATASQSAHRLPVLASLLAALATMVLANWLAEVALVKLAARVLPPGRLRRSVLAIAIVASNVLLVGLAAHGAYTALDAQGVWGPLTRKLALAAAQSIVFMAFVVGLGRALLANARPTWRLPPIPDAMAARLAPFPWLTALTALLVWAPTQINDVVEASLAAVVATHAVSALALTGLIAAALSRLRGTAGHAPAGAEAAEGTAAAPPASARAPAADAPEERPLWVAMLLGAVTVVLIAIWVLVAVGYVALASFLAGQLTWAGIVVSAFYLLFKFADDLCMAVVASRSGFGQRLQHSFGFAPQTLDQAAVVLSGLLRVALFFYLVIAVVTPLGTSPGEVFQRSGQFGTGVKVGEFQLVPSAIFSAVAVLVGGFVVLGVLKRWLGEHYLPTTTFEPGMRSSILTLLGYAGGILVVAVALSALGLGIERIAWIASALSVGIGFGLQAIVQNFISGLILLAERPVKVGDWVVLGNAEGDVQRINVRATEIRLGDRSTLIVPNSEFITKTVRNMTLQNAEGRVLIRLPMPLTTDAAQVRDLMLSSCHEHPAVLATPEPSLTLEGIENGLLIFQAIAYVSGPRAAGGVRSDLLFTMLERLNAAQLPLAAWAPAPLPGMPAMPGVAPVAVVPPLATS